jgi:hypothetical protein
MPIYGHWWRFGFYLSNTDRTQQFRAAVAGENQGYPESIYAGSGLVLASLLLVFCCLEFGGLPASLRLLKLSYFLIWNLVLVLIWIKLDHCVKILVKIFTTDCWIVWCVF